MSSWTIYGANGVAKAVVKELELHDEWMAECFVTVTVKSHEPIDFEVGDYIDYRDERYSINYDPTILKKARRDTYGEGFTYDNIKFVAVQDEIVRCDFNDIVLSDNNIHYTMLPTFPFYCENVEDLLDRVQANLEELYPNGWIVIGLDRNKARQRGLCVGREQAFIDAYERYIGDVDFEYEKTGIALTADNNNCWEALKWANEQFELNFFVRGRVVVVGTSGAVTGRKFRYGKGNGLYEIERISDSEQKIITRLRGYGAETNLPLNYYANLHKKAYFTVVDKTDLPSTISATEQYQLISDLTWSSTRGAIINNTYVTLSHHGEKAEATFYSTTTESTEEPTTISSGVSVNLCLEVRDVDFWNSVAIGDRVYIYDGVNTSAWPTNSTEIGEDFPTLLSINRLMLPGFPDKSLAEWVEDNMDNPKVAAIVAEGFTFSDNVMRPWIDSPNKNVIGLRPASIYFDGNNDNKDIHPSIEEMTWSGHRVDVIVSADQIDDNGYIEESNGTTTEKDKRFTITIPYAGFDFGQKYKKDETTISMKDGMCGARDFKVMKQPTQDAATKNWIVTLERQYDETLKIYFPYNDFQIASGDHFVITGIDLPKSYVEAASEELFFESVDALRANHSPRFTFQPRIDEIWMQRQHDTAVASGGAVESLHDTLKSGDLFSFADDDLGIDAKIIIDILTIKENGNNGIPTYEVTLRDEKIASALDKKLDKITSVVSGVGGGMTSRQYSGMIEVEGSDLFLSKIYDDVAQGVIGFLKGVWFGVKKWFIDADGNANFNDTTVNGLLKAYNAMINNVRSTNYTGDGMMDSGWRITNEYEGGNSKATFDFLYIRKKAIFEELEIRKLSHIGGNFCLSGASGRAWKVDYYDANDNLLGYDTYTVPWTLFSRIMILFKPHNAANRYLAKRKVIQRKLTDAEKLLVRKCRVYMYNDDGTTETMSNWTVGAQARCQTFNVESQMEFDGSSWTGKKVGNTYWYRLVTAVSTNPVTLEDGQKHHYIEFSIDPTQEGHAYAWADAGSDLPSKGDVFVQLGHRTREDQSNVIMLETANEDSPAIKMYAGVNWWTYNDKLVAVMSPDGWRVVSNKFEWITEYGERFQTTVNRGVWVEITPDEQGKRKCYYNDMVSHNGAYWRCIVSQDTYTTDEPSESSSAWSKEVYAAIAPYVKLSEALVAVPCEKNSVSSAAFSKTIVPKLMLTNLECTLTSVTLEGADSHVYKSGNNIIVNFASGASVTNKDYTVTLEGDYDGNHYVASDKLSVYAVIRGNDGYEILGEPNTFIFTQQKESPYSINLDGSETGNSSTKISVVNDGVAQPFRITNVVATGKDGSGQAVQGITTNYSNTSGRVWITHIPNNVEKGELAITVTYGSNSSHTLILQFYCNLIGTWQEQVVGDTKTEIATKMQFDICDETGAVISTSTLANFTKSSSQQSATLTKTTESQGQAITATNERVDTAESSIQTLNNGLGSTNQRVSTAESNIQTLSTEIDTVDGKFSSYSTTQQTSQMISQQVSTATQGMVTTSNFEQTASSFSLITESTATNIAQNKANSAENDVIQRLGQTGIKIDGTNREIDLIGDKVKFYKSDGRTEANIYFDNVGGNYIFGWLRATNGADLDGSEIYIGGAVTSTIQICGGSSSTLRIGIDADGIVTSTVSLGRTTHAGYAYFNDDVIFNDLTEFNAKADFKKSAVFEDIVCFNSDGKNIIFGQGTKYLPSNPTTGQIVFTKGTTGSMTVNGNGKSIRTSSGADIVSSVGGEKRSRFFIYDGTYWDEFYCD